MPSVRQIAKMAGVSSTTVSRALNNDPSVRLDTREKVLTAANSVGYVPTIVRRATASIGFSYTGEPTISHPFDSAVLEGVTKGVDECRFDVVILNLQRDKKLDESYTQFFMRKGVRGIVLRTMADARHICQAIADEGFPVFVISERFDAPNINCIDCDSKPDSVRAVEYLISLGHRRVGFAMHNVPDRDHMDRFEGYKQALANHGLPFDDKLVFRHRYTLAGGATVMQVVLTMRDPPTALYFADPLLAVGAVKQAHESQVRIPEDLSIIGFDDTNIRFSVYPTLTAVCQDAGALGYEAALHMTRRLQGQTNGKFQKSLPTFFEVNRSTGRPPDPR